MKNVTQNALISFALASLLILATEAQSKPRQPLPPLPERCQIFLRFNETNWWGNLQPPPLFFDNIQLVESWSGYAYYAALKQTSRLQYPIATLDEKTGRTRTNLNLSTGSLRFWFQPNWTSVSLGGTGPGVFGRLVEAGAWSQDASYGLWSLSCSDDGDTLYFTAQAGGQEADYLKAPIQWQTGVWHLITLTYGPKLSELYIDGELVVQGTGVTLWPDAKVQAVHGFSIGNDLTGQAAAGGAFEEFTAFGYPLSAEEIAHYHKSTRPIADLGPVTPEEEEATQARWLEFREAALLALEATSLETTLLLGPTSSCLTNVPVHLTNIVCVFDTNQGWTVTFDIQGGTNGLLYDVFATTVLPGNSITDSQWSWIERGPTCSTYQYTNMPQAMAFFVLGDASVDPDADGLSTAFEQLVSKSDPQNADTDGDGLPDGFEVLGCLTSPLLPDTGTTGYTDDRKDFDGDGLTNLEEYKAGTNPSQADVRPPYVTPGQGTYLQPQTPRIYCFTEGATIHYTLDGSDPTTNSPTIPSGGSLSNSISTATTLKAKAWKAGLIPSTATVVSYSFAVATPVFFPGGGIYGPGLEVWLSSPTPGGIIYYTLDGSEPTLSSATYTNGSPIPITADTTVKARAWLGEIQSGTASSLYSIRTAPANDMFTNRQTVSGLNGVVRGSNIGADVEDPEWCYFNYDDWSVLGYSVWFQWVAPTNTSIAFDVIGDFEPAIEVFAGTEFEPCINMTLVAHYWGYTETGAFVDFNATAGQPYQIRLRAGPYADPGNYVLRWYTVDQVGQPILSNPGGTFRSAQLVRVTCNTPRSTIRYTIDGSEPAEQSSSLANGSSISITRSLTFKTRAWREGALPSDVATAVFLIDPNATAPTATTLSPSPIPANTNFTGSVAVAMQSQTTNATIYFTTDGTEPYAGSSTVTNGGSIVLTNSTCLKLKAAASGMNPSPTVTAFYAKENQDTDYDGIPDPWEMQHGSDMFFPDAAATSTEPFGHGLNNQQVYGTPSVLTADNYSTLGDGIPDWWKAQYGYSITDPAATSAFGANGLTLAESYQNVLNPNDPNARPDTLPQPSYSIRLGPQNHLYLILHSLSAEASHLRLYCADFPDEGWSVGPEFVIDFVLPSPPPKVIEIPASRLATGHAYEFSLQVQDSSGRVSVPYRSLGAIGEGPYGRKEYQEFVDFTADTRRLVEWRLRFAGGSPWLSTNSYDQSYWRYVGLPARDFGQWADTFIGLLPGQPYPRSQVNSPLYIGDFTNLAWSAATAYPFPDDDPYLFHFSGWDLRNAGLSVTSTNDQGQYRYFINWSAPSSNLFGLPYTAFEFHFPDTTFTLTPGTTIEVSYSNAYVLPAQVYQAVQAPATVTTNYLFAALHAQGYTDGFADGPVSYFYPPSPGVTDGNATAVENPTITLNVEESIRVYGYSKEVVKLSGGAVIPGQFFYVQQYFDKAFRCHDVTGDVPRTSEDNVGGKKKINVALAVQSGLLSPYGNLTPTNIGKYVLTTVPNANGEYGECTVYVLPNEIVTRDPDDGIERPVDDTFATTAPVPDVTLSLLSANINAQGSLDVTVSARVMDRLSEVADDPTERLQELKFIFNGEVIDTVTNLPALSPGSGVLPWQPYRLDVTVQRTYTVPSPGGRAFLLRAETSENAAGNVGWDEIGIGVGLDTVPFAGDTNPVAIAFAQAPTTNAVDSFQIYFGNRAPDPGDPTCTESAAGSWLFNGSLNVSGSLRPSQVQIFGGVTANSGVVDTFDAEVTYQLADGSSRSLLGTFTESGTNTLRFVNTFSASGITTPLVWQTEEREGSPKGSFEPILVRFSAPRYLVETSGVSAAVNDIPQGIAPFTFSPEKYYLVARTDETKPRLLVVTAKSLPPGLTALTPENLVISQEGDDLKVQVQHEGRQIAGATVEVFKDDYKVERRLFGWIQAPVTMPVLLSYYKLLYGETGLKLLNYFELGGGIIELGDVIGDVDVDWSPPNIVVQVEEDVHPVQAANLLWTGLNRALGFKFIRDKVDEFEDLDLFLSSLHQVGPEATRVGIAAANGYLTGLSILNEGADIAVTLNDVSEGHYAAAIGLLPFVPSGARYIWKKADGTILHTFTKQVADRVMVALGKPTRLERLENLRQAMSEGLVTPEMMKAFIEGGAVPRYSKGYSYKLLTIELETHVGAKPSVFHQAHHDLPLEFLDFFLQRGLDPNKAEYGRWVKGTRPGSDGLHQVWSRPFNEEWERWIFKNPSATDEDILSKMQEMRVNPRYQ